MSAVSPLAAALAPEPANDAPAPDAANENRPPDLARLRRMFEESRDLTADARNEALVDRRYYDGAQWTSEEKRALAARSQPDTVFERIKPAINGIVGVVEQGQTEPRALPRNPDDTDSADVATDVLTYIADKQRFHRRKSAAFLNYLIEGVMAAIVEVNADRDVTITRIRWEEFFYDARSREWDFTDARYKGIAKWMYADDVIAAHPGKRGEIEGQLEGGGSSWDQTFADRPFSGAGSSWCDRKARRLLVIELYYREAGAWQHCVFTGAALLSYGPSPYLDDRGRPTCPIEAEAAYIDTDNNRYGAVRAMRGPQDEINKRRSKLLHRLSVSQIEVAFPDAIDVDAEVARREAAKPDGVIPYGWRRVALSEAAQVEVALLAEAKAEIERMGPNPAVLGRDGADASGRALLARRQAGMVELALLFGGLEDWELRIYRQCWARAKQFWSAPQWVRVTDDQDAPKFVGINQPVLEHEDAGMGPDGQPVVRPKLYAQIGQDGQIVADPQTGQPALVPNVLGYKNAVAEMDVDIEVETTADMDTLRHETLQSFIQLLTANPAWAQQVPLETVITMAGFPHTRRILDQLKAHQQEQAQAGAQSQQVQQTQIELAVRKALADIQKTDSETALNNAKAGQAHASTVLDAVTAGHETINALPPVAEAPFGANGRDPSGSIGSQPPQG